MESIFKSYLLLIPKLIPKIIFNSYLIPKRFLNLKSYAENSSYLIRWIWNFCFWSLCWKIILEAHRGLYIWHVWEGVRMNMCVIRCIWSSNLSVFDLKYFKIFVTLIYLSLKCRYNEFYRYCKSLSVHTSWLCIWCILAKKICPSFISRKIDCWTKERKREGEMFWKALKQFFPMSVVSFFPAFIVSVYTVCAPEKDHFGLI